MRPLDFLRSIKVKLGVVIVASVALTTTVVLVGERLAISPLLTAVAAGVAALAMIHFLSRGMTHPLREMVGAAQAMARGDYSRRVTATSRDEVGELARAFNSMARELDEVDRMRRDLVANASHELRTPIGVLQAKLENIVDGVEAGDRLALEAALAQVERLGDLVAQLLDLSKLESGAVPLARTWVPAAHLLGQVERELQEAAAAREVEVRATIEPASLVLDCDEQRMRQVVSNLVANAIRHTPRAGVVRVVASGAGATRRIEVVDDGPGIPPDEAERVFQRFYRSDRARSADGGGAGLGLAIARWIVDLHGGRIYVDTSRRPGCRMVVELPG